MYIKSLIYEDQSTGWKLEKIEFNNPLTLLVGVSGVGKSQILKALLNLQGISGGYSFNGLKWELDFKTSTGHDCKWHGEIENTISDSEHIHYFIDKKNQPNFFSEQLFIDNVLIVDRTKDDIIFDNQKTVKLSQQESVIYLLQAEDKIKDVHSDFKKIIFDDNGDIDSIKSTLNIEYLYTESEAQEYKDLKNLRSSSNSVRKKFHLLYFVDKDTFRKIVNDFSDIFPYIEDIKIEPITRFSNSPDSVLRQYPFIQIKEKNVSYWIDELKMSSGMRRTLMHIAELYLCADNSVILIDEFENSLGINCIDELTSSILTSERNLQFIITSHHPYIINDIGFAHWKIVTRKGSVVKTTDAEKLGIGRSKHQAFTQLANLTEYSEGIES